MKWIADMIFDVFYRNHMSAGQINFRHTVLFNPKDGELR